MNLLDAVNKRAYADSRTVSWYQDLDNLDKVEEVILEKIFPLIKDKKLLDIGIGGGRTTGHLLAISQDYTGIDYTPRCAEIVSARFPAANICCADARDLSRFAEPFDFVLFSFNGLDYIEPEDRLRALSEIYRVLKPGGWFMFSSHNRDCRSFNKMPWQQAAPFTIGHLKNCLYTLAYWPRHLKMKKHEVFTDEYAIVNDTAHKFSLLAYYISSSKQIRQLERLGFVETAAYDLEGNRIEHDNRFPWTYYLTRKPAGDSDL